MGSRTSPRPRKIADLVRDLRRAQHKGRDRGQGTAITTAGIGQERNPASRGERGRAMFLVGAGCSKSAGIPLASEVAMSATIWLANAYQIPDVHPGMTATEALEALVEAEHFPGRFHPRSGTPRWGDLYSYIFSHHIKHPNEQRDFLAELVDSEDLLLNWSHACLGELVKQRFVHTVLTTNFDQLVLKGIIRTGIVPVVADGLESLSRISPSPRWPQVVHVHGSKHTYELRNSYEALRETQDDRGLQSLMLNILKETTVLVVVGYFGGEEGIMHLLQDAAKALPRMVVYWIAYEKDYAFLSDRARELLEIGEHKYFILNQEADDFFNQLLGELGIGTPGWISDPLSVLLEQGGIKSSDTTSGDVGRLIQAYRARVEYASSRGRKPDGTYTRAIMLRSENRFREAAEFIEGHTSDYRESDDLLRLHAISLVAHHNRLSEPDETTLRTAINELTTLVERCPRGDPCDTALLDHRSQAAVEEEAGAQAREGVPGPNDGSGAVPRSGPHRLVLDTETLIEARRDLNEMMSDDRKTERVGLVRRMGREAGAAQPYAEKTGREWAVMEFYKAESCQLRAEHLKHRPQERGARSTEIRGRILEVARSSYEAALIILSGTDMERAKECREGLAGALSDLAELLLEDSAKPCSEDAEKAARARSYLRQSKALFLEVIDFLKRNAPGREPLAGAYENLADLVETTAKHQPGEARSLRGEAFRLLQEAYDIYESNLDIKNATRMQSRMNGLGPSKH